MKYRTYRKLQALLMGALGFFLLERFWSGQLMIYINRRYQWLIVITAFGLFALALITFNHLPPVWKEDEGLLSHEIAPQSAKWRLILLFFPLLLGVLIPARPLGASVAEQRGVSQSLPLAAGGSAPVSLELEPHNRSILQWLWAFEVLDDPDSLSGQQASIQGFTFTNPDLPDDYFMVGRFIVSCCVADAVVVAIAVQPPADGEVPAGWVHVQGQVEISDINGKDTLMINATQINPIDEPDQPYLYP